MDRTFGRYTVIGELGHGAMGVVYLAADPMLNRKVAVKTVDLAVDDPGEKEFLRHRLLRDARAAAVLKHPNIVDIYDVFEDGGRAYVVMEYVEGNTLSARLKNRPLPEASEILTVVRQAADALDYTHERGVIHRDIKPANIMIDSTGNTRIMDFGIARISDTRTCTPTGMVMGTVEYMAPEQILGEALDGRADQYALGVVAYQIMTGSTLFGPNTLATLAYKLVNEAPPVPSTRNPLLPRGVDAVLTKVLAKKPCDRFTTCTAFAHALAHAFGALAPLALPTGSAATVPEEQTTIGLSGSSAIVAPPRRLRASVVATGIAVLVLGGLAGVIWRQGHRSQPGVVSVAHLFVPSKSGPVTAGEVPAEPKAGVKTKAASKSEAQGAESTETEPTHAIIAPSPGPNQKASFSGRRGLPPPTWAQITSDIRKHYGSATTIGPLGDLSFSRTESDAADPWAQPDNWEPTGTDTAGELCRQFVEIDSRQPSGAMMETHVAVLYQLRRGRWQFLDIKIKPPAIQK